MTVIYLVRHAESQPHSDIPEPDWPLSPKGVEQARQLVGQLSGLGISGIYSSPFPRALATVRPFAGVSGLDVKIHEDLRERKLAPGKLSDFRAVLRQSWSDFSFKVPGGESSEGAQTRVVNAIREITSEHPGSTLVVVSHGNAISLFLNSIDPAFSYDQWAAMKNPDAFKLHGDGGQFSWDRAWSLPYAN